MGKITVKHYLNKRLKPSEPEANGVLYYPVYLHIIFNKKQYQIKSRAITHYYNEEEFNSINIKGSKLYILANEERMKIERLILKLQEISSKTLNYKELLSHYEFFSRNIYEILYSSYDDKMSNYDFDDKGNVVVKIDNDCKILFNDKNINQKLNNLSEAVFHFRDFDRKKQLDVFSWKVEDVKIKFIAFMLKEKNLKQDKIQEIIKIIDEALATPEFYAIELK